MRSESPPLIEIRGLSKVFAPRRSIINLLSGAKRKSLTAVDNVSIDIQRGEIFSLVGESGSGKTTLGRVLLRLIEPSSGGIFFRGEDLRKLSKSQMLVARRDLQMIFQDPFSSLNPRMTVRQTLAEVLLYHRLCHPNDLDARIRSLLELVGLSNAHAERYPRDFSGGQRQRIGIARALAVNPAFIVADEPVSAVDVSVQAQIMNLLLDLRDRLDLTLFFIAHDLSVVRYVSSRVGVMYLGRLVEIAPVRALFADPRHPYTQGLLRAAPRPDPRRRSAAVAIKGEPPSAMDPPSGCHFHTRCPLATDLCKIDRPELRAIDADHFAACHHHEKAATQWSQRESKQVA